MFCTKCGNELADGAKFCTKCGNPVEAVTKESTPDVKNEANESAENKKEELDKEEVKVEESKPEEDNNIETQTEASPAENVNEENKALAQPDNSKSVKVIIGAVVGVVALIAVVVLVYFVFIRKNPIDELKAAFDDNDYKTAKRIVKEDIADTKREDEAEDLVAEEIEDIKARYKSGDIKIDEAEEAFDDLGKLKLDIDDEIEDALKWVNKVRNSESQFEVAQSQYDDGYYEGAIEYCKEVIKDDRHYDEAQDLIEKCKDAIVDKALENAQNEIDNGYYSSATYYLDNAKEEVGEDNEKLKQAYSTIEGKIVEKALEKAKEYAESGDNYGVSSAVSELANVYKSFPDNKDIAAKYEEYSNLYVDNWFMSIMDSMSYYKGYPDELSQAFDNVKEQWSENEFVVKHVDECKTKLIETFVGSIDENIKNGSMYEASKLLSILDSLAPDDEKVTGVKEKYAALVDMIKMDDVSIDLTQGSAYSTSYYDDEKGYSFDNAYRLSAYTFDKYGSMTVDVTGYKAVSGVVLFTGDSMDGTGKFVINAGKDQIFKTEVSASKTNIAFNVKIPDGNNKIVIRWVKDSKSEDKSLYMVLANACLMKEYCDGKDVQTAQPETDNDASSNEQGEGAEADAQGNNEGTEGTVDGNANGTDANSPEGNATDTPAAAEGE